MEQITVMENVKGKYGPQIKDKAGKFYSFGKFYKGPTEFPLGSSFEADLFKSEKGNSYINNVGKVTVPTEPVVVAPKVKPLFKAKADTSMTKEEWQAKDRSQLIGGLGHDAAELVAALSVLSNLNTEEKLINAYKNVLLGILKVRDELR